MSEPACVNLRERFGERYKISHDEAADSLADPWYQTIRCARGLIYPHGGEVLAVEIDGHPILAGMVGRLPGVRLWQDGQTEKTFLFDASLFDLVAALVRPYKRPPPLSPERRQRLIAMGQEFRFPPAAGQIGGLDEQTGTVEPSSDPEAG